MKSRKPCAPDDVTCGHRCCMCQLRLVVAACATKGAGGVKATMRTLPYEELSRRIFDAAPVRPSTALANILARYPTVPRTESFMQFLTSRLRVILSPNSYQGAEFSFCCSIIEVLPVTSGSESCSGAVYLLNPQGGKQLLQLSSPPWLVLGSFLVA